MTLISIITYIIFILVQNLDKIALWSIFMESNKVLDEMVRRFPSNLQICQYILNKLGNNHTKIKEEKESKTSLYLERFFIG